MSCLHNPRTELHRPHAAEEVYVTGTFDDWSKSAKLEKNGDVFEKTIALPEASEKIYYKVRRELSARVLAPPFSPCRIFPLCLALS